jgi:hypothetical protein
MIIKGLPSGAAVLEGLMLRVESVCYSCRRSSLNSSKVARHLDHASQILPIVHYIVLCE